MYRGIRARFLDAIRPPCELSANLYADKMSILALIKASLASDKLDFNERSTAKKKVIC